jgi:hypothetical protein
MHVLVARLLQGAALAAALAAALLLSRALHLLFTCLRAKRQFLASPLPGPPLPSAIIGERVVTVCTRGRCGAQCWRTCTAVSTAGMRPRHTARVVRAPWRTSTRILCAVLQR